jgi:hypothetical protein
MTTKYTREVLIEAVSRSRSYSQLIRNLGIRAASGGSHSHLKKLVSEYGIDTGHFLGMAWAKKVAPGNKLDPKDILIVLSGHRRARPHQLRRALIESGVPFVCNSCTIRSEWNGKPLNLEVDHIDGNWRDCRKHNLQFLCPNCHSQKGATRINTCECGKLIRLKSTTCKKCLLNKVRHLVQPKVIGTWPSTSELARRVWEIPVISLATEIGVSGSMVKKRCKRLGINTPPIGYWAKVKKSMVA